MKEVDHSHDEDRDLHDRLAKLASAIEKKQSESVASDQKAARQDAMGGETGKAMSLGFRILAELVGGVVVGALIGWQIDQWTGWSPLFLIVFLGLGLVAGFMNMMKAAAGTNRLGQK